MKILVDVTDSDIVLGMRRDTARCPIALSLKRLFPNCFKVVVEPNKRWIAGDSRSGGFHFWMSGEVAAILRDYDRGGEMKPFTFEVSI